MPYSFALHTFVFYTRLGTLATLYFMPYSFALHTFVFYTRLGTLATFHSLLASCCPPPTVYHSLTHPASYTLYSYTLYSYTLILFTLYFVLYTLYLYSYYSNASRSTPTCWALISSYWLYTSYHVPCMGNRQNFYPVTPYNSLLLSKITPPERSLYFWATTRSTIPY